MSVVQFHLPQADGLWIARSAAMSLVSAKSGDAALVYLYLLTQNGAFDPAAAAQLGLEKDALAAAVEKLAALGLLSPTQEKVAPAAPLDPPEETPAYTVSDIQAEIQGSGVFAALVDDTQRRLGRVLSGTDLVTLFGIYHGLGLPPEVIMLLVTYCLEEYQEKYGAGRRPTLRAIEKTAYIWAREELFTLDRAEAYLQNQARQKEQTAQVQKALGLTGRQLSRSEKQYIAAWLDMGFDLPVLEQAYDKTVLKTGGLSWPYMNSILKSWHEKGLHTLEAIAQGDSRPGAALSKPGRASAGDMRDIQRARQLLDKMKQGK